MSFETLRYEIADRILILTLNRPERMNAFTARMADELIDAFDKADADDSIKVVIVTGAGAKLGFVFAGRGIVPEACSSWFLPRIVGISRALEWCFSARIFKSEEGLEAGLLRSIHSSEELLPQARALAKEFIDNSSAVSIALIRQMMWRMLNAPHPIDAHEIDTAALAALGTSADAKEGISAFLEKRPARFTDRVSSDLPSFVPWWTDRQFRKL